MKYTYFEVPTQVKFFDYDGRHYVGGIAYRDEIICGCCGGIFNISDIYQFSPITMKEFDDEPIIVINKWQPIDYEICGECY